MPAGVLANSLIRSNRRRPWHKHQPDHSCLIIQVSYFGLDVTSTHQLFTDSSPAAFTACPHLQVVVVIAPTEKSSLVGMVAHDLFMHIPTAAFSACPHLQVVVVSCASTLKTLHCLCWSLTGCSLKTNPVTACLICRWSWCLHP